MGSRLEGELAQATRAEPCHIPLKHRMPKLQGRLLSCTNRHFGFRHPAAYRHGAGIIPFSGLPGIGLATPLSTGASVTASPSDASTFIADGPANFRVSAGGGMTFPSASSCRNWQLGFVQSGNRQSTFEGPLPSIDHELAGGSYHTYMSAYR